MTFMQHASAGRPHDDPDVMARLAGLDVRNSGLVLDALDILHLAGPAGLMEGDWRAEIRSLHGSSDETLLPLIRVACEPMLLVTTEPFGLRYRWLHRGERPLEIDATTARSVRITSDCLALMRRMPRFTAETLARELGQQAQLPAATALSLVQHMLAQFPATLRRYPDGTLSFAGEVPRTRSETVTSLKLMMLHPDLRLVDKAMVRDYLCARRSMPRPPNV